MIGNPPYVEAKKLKYIASTLKDSYNLYSGTADFSVYFIEQAFRLLSPKGIASYITTNKFFNTGYGQSVRSLLSSLDINILLNFEQVEVFKDVLVSSVIFNIRKADSIRNKHFIYEKFYKMNCEQFKAEFVNRLNSLGKYPQNCLGDKEWSFVDTASLELQKKIEREATLLGKVGGVKIYRGVTTGYNPAFIISDEQRDKLIAEDPNNEVVIKNLLQGRNIRKWVYEESNLFLLQTGYDINIPIEYPYINNHLKNFEEELTKRADQGVNWWNLRACQYYPEFEKPEKIIWGLTAAKWAFAYDDKKHYLPSNGYILTSTNIPILYLLGWLNSKLMHHYFHYIGVMTAGGAYTLKAATIEALPFKTPESTLAIENLVSTILSAKQQVPSADTSREEQEIDRQVYKLYGLTYEEVRIVDPDTPISEEEYNKGKD